MLPTNLKLSRFIHKSSAVVLLAMLPMVSCCTRSAEATKPNDYAEFARSFADSRKVPEREVSRIECWKYRQFQKLLRPSIENIEERAAPVFILTGEAAQRVAAVIRAEYMEAKKMDLNDTAQDQYVMLITRHDGLKLTFWITTYGNSNGTTGAYFIISESSARPLEAAAIGRILNQR